MAESPPERAQRVASLDQLRGYAIFGMLLVNASGFFHLSFEQLKHHREGFAYADTIAPLFVFVVGIGMRLSWLRRCEQAGAAATRRAMVRRYSLLVLIAFAIYAGWLWDALMDIGLAGLLAVMLIDRNPRTRIIAAFLMVAAYQALCLFTVYGDWITRAIRFEDGNTPLLIRLIPLHGELFEVALNGGPLGPLSWCMMLLFGTVTHDLLAAGDERKLVTGCLAWSAGLCLAGYALHLEWPGLKGAWPFSAYSMTAPFPLWATGLCLLHFLGFHLLCDRWGRQIPTLTALGMNPLFIYILQHLVVDVADGFKPAQLPLAVGLVSFALFYGLFFALAHSLYRKGVYIKI